VLRSKILSVYTFLNDKRKFCPGVFVLLPLQLINLRGLYASERKTLVEAPVIFFCTLSLTDGLPTLTVQSIQKSKDFMKANCFDNSKLILQLNNGKILH
jgi:hypothetical protein